MISFKDYKLNRIEYPTSLFEGLADKHLRMIESLAYNTNIIEMIVDISKIIKDLEGRLYLLFRLFLQKINPNYNNGITGISISYDKYYKMTQYSNIDECFRPSEAEVKTTKISKEKKDEIIKGENSYIINRSDLCYTKILKYDKYEFTNNIAYEFAKRSKFPFAEMELHYIFKKILLKFLSDEYHAELKNDIFQVDYIKNAITTDDNFSDLLYFFKNNKTTLETIYNDFTCYTKTIKEFHSEEEYYLHTLQYYNNIPEEYLKIMQVDILRPNFKSPILPQSEEFIFDLRINMALPEDEIVEYIKKVRKELLIQEDMNDLNILALINLY